MSTDSPVSKTGRLRWLPVVFALVAGIGIGLVVDRFGLPRAAQPSGPELADPAGHWNEKLEQQHLRHRQDPSKWDLELLKADLELNGKRRL